MGDFTFEPEEVYKSFPWQLASEEAKRSYQEKEVAMKKYLNNFYKEFVPEFIATYNKDANKLGIPKLDPKWLNIIPKLTATVGGPKQFYIKNRAQLEQKMFPGEPNQSKKAYELFLKRLEQDPYIESGPSSAFLSHEVGHLKSFWTDPKEVIHSRKIHDLKNNIINPPIGTALNEAVASYRGFKLQWNVWVKWGIPKKAWGAWMGFPTYLSNFSQSQINLLFKRLKILNNKLPGIYDMAYKTVYEYNNYIRPVLYNIPGKDWTDKEKQALKKWIESRGGVYEKKIPENAKEREKHLLKQPYVMQTKMQEKNVIGEFKLAKAIKKENLDVKRTANSLFKIIEFYFYRVPENKRNEYFFRTSEKIKKLSPIIISNKKPSFNSIIGQSISLSKNILNGLNPLFVKDVLIELTKLLNK